MATSSADRIVDDLRKWISGVGAGTALPPSRELAARYGAGPVTVQRAMHTLVGLGLVETRPGAGSFVRAQSATRMPGFGWQTTALRSAGDRVPVLSTPLRDAAVDAIGLHSGYPAAEVLPERAVRAALARAGRSTSISQRSAAAGLPDLRAWFAAELHDTTPAGVTPVSARDVIVVPGTQSGLSSTFRALAEPGQPVLVESPTYWGAILAAAQAGVQLIPVAGDDDGPNPDDLRRAFTQTGARLFYGQPTFANPTGATWSASRREQILDVLRAVGAFLIEDDWAKDFGIDSDPVPLAGFDDSGHVIYLRSLTKSVSPAIRVGALIARGPVRDRLLADRAAESMYVSGVLQAAALDVVLQPAWRSHLRGLRSRLRDRRDALAEAVSANLPVARIDRLPSGGLNLWVGLPPELDLDRWVRDCESDGVLIAAGTEWFPTDPTGNYVRLNYSGPDPERFADGTRIIGRLLTQQLDSGHQLLP